MVTVRNEKLRKITNKGSRLRVSILNVLKTSPSTAQGIHDILYEQWDLRQIKNTIAYMVQDLQLSHIGHGKSTIYALKKPGQDYLEKFIELLNKKEE